MSENSDTIGMRANARRAEVDLLRETVRDQSATIRALEEVRSTTCECGVDEACRFVRERDAAVERAEKAEAQRDDACRLAESAARGRKELAERIAELEGALRELEWCSFEETPRTEDEVEDRRQCPGCGAWKYSVRPGTHAEECDVDRIIRKALKVTP